MNQEKIDTVINIMVEQIKKCNLRIYYGHNHQVNFSKGTEIPIINEEWLGFLESDDDIVHYIKIDSIYEICCFYDVMEQDDLDDFI